MLLLFQTSAAYHSLLQQMSTTVATRLLPQTPNPLVQGRVAQTGQRSGSEANESPHPDLTANSWVCYLSGASADRQKARKLKLMPFRKMNPEIGSRPGTLVIPEDSPETLVHITVYDESGSETLREVSDSDIERYMEDERFLWFDIQGFGNEERIRKLGSMFGLGNLQLEDAINVPHRAKTDIGDEFHTVIARMPMVDGTSGHMDVPQVCIFFTAHWVVTFQERYFGFFDPVRQRLVAGIGQIRQLGPPYLVYALIDTLVDRFYPIAESLSQQLDELEADITENPAADILADVHRIRQRLTVLRRIGRPQREVLNELGRAETPFISKEVRAYFKDSADHYAQIMELIDSSREMAIGLSEIYMANVSHRTNEVMKVLTLMASVFIPLTFIAGIYGMNFENMPELQQRNSYFVVLGVMVLVAGGMVYYFIRRGWIGGGGGK